MQKKAAERYTDGILHFYCIPQGTINPIATTSKRLSTQLQKPGKNSLIADSNKRWLTIVKKKKPICYLIEDF